MPVDIGLQGKRIAKGKRPGDPGGGKLTPLKTALVQPVLRDLPNSRMYLDYRELDLRVEQYSNRKKAEISDLHQQSDVSLRCLRLQLYNRHFHQGSTDPAFPPSWSFYVSGHFVDHNQGTGAQSSQQAAPQPTHGAATPLAQHVAANTITAESERKKGADRHWTSAMASIQIRIDDRDDPSQPSEVIRWERNRHMGQHKECIELHRLGNRKKRIGITMVRDFAPAYHLLKAPLRERLGIPGGTRGYILRKFKAYVQEHSSPNQVDPCVLRPDGDLKSLLREEGSIDISSLGDRLQPFLVPRDPVSLHYVVQLDGPSPANVDCYDVEVAWNLRPALLRLPPFLDHLNPAHPLEALDQNIAEVLLALRSAENKRRILMGFATDPDWFIRQLIARSAQEVRELDGQAVQVSSADHFKLPWAQEAAVQHLYSIEQREASNYAAAGQRQ